jgi:TPR repeat protein
MKTRRLIFLGAVFTALLISTAQAQYNARRLTRRIGPQVAQPPAPQAQTNTAAQLPAPATPTPAVTPPAPPPPRVVRPPIDPEEAKAAREKADKKALEFQKKRAEEGSDSAQYELGIRYLKGDGVVKDEGTARKWLAMSSKSGYGPATRKLEELDKSNDQPPVEAKTVKAEGK